MNEDSAVCFNLKFSFIKIRPALKKGRYLDRLTDAAQWHPSPAHAEMALEQKPMTMQVS
jgi:hypothetical protein